MKILSAIALVFLLVSMVPAQSPPPNPTDSGLELRLQPEHVQNGVPAAFTFLMVNRSNRDVRLPMPDMECGSVPQGTIRLRLNFVPLKSGPTPPMTGCVNDYVYQPILDRVKSWKMLRPGESLSLGITEGRVLAGAAGKYDYWAHYTPPGMPQADEEVLQKAGINFPKVELESAHVKLVKKP